MGRALVEFWQGGFHVPSPSRPVIFAGDRHRPASGSTMPVAMPGDARLRGDRAPSNLGLRRGALGLADSVVIERSLRWRRMGTPPPHEILPCACRGWLLKLRLRTSSAAAPRHAAASRVMPLNSLDLNHGLRRGTGLLTFGRRLMSAPLANRARDQGHFQQSLHALPHRNQGFQH